MIYTDKGLELVLEQAISAHAIALMRYEMALSAPVLVELSPEKLALQNYGRSTLNRKRFIQLFVIAGLAGEPQKVSECTKLLGISRNAVDVMWKECTEAGWIVASTGKQGARFGVASRQVVDVSKEYAAALEKLAVSTGLVTAAANLRVLKGAVPS